jgi:sortase A
MKRQLRYIRQPWYRRELRSKRQLLNGCQVWYARGVRWFREPLRPWDLLSELELRLRRIPHKTVLRVAEDFLWVVALASLGLCSVAYGSAAIHQARQKAVLSALRANAAAPAPLASTAQTSRSKVANSVLLGLIEIPRLDTASIVEEGVETSTLWKAVGHIPGTALPGERGNAVLAAHRDTYFSGLGDLKVGDMVSFKSPTATYSYRVESTRIVEPDDAEVLRPSNEPTLTLVTCYPFQYIGNAPRRYVVTARQEQQTASESE